MSRLLVIGAGKFQADGIRRAKELGHWVVAADGDAKAPGFAIADAFEVCDVLNVDANISVARKHKIDAVCSFSSDVSMRSVAGVAEALDLPGLSPDAALRATDKGYMREALQAAGIPVPAFRVLTGEEGLSAAARSIDFPMVVKPTDNAGSRGVQKVDSPMELTPAFRWAKRHSRSGRVICESFMDGTEISVEGFVTGGEMKLLTLSDKVRTPPPFLLDTEVLFPSEHPDSVQDAAVDMARRAAKALGLDACPVHMELLLTPDGPRVVELAARGAGFHVYSGILPHVTGVDTLGAVISAACGQAPNLRVSKLKGAVLRFFPVTAGVVRSVEGLAETRALAGVYDADCYVKPGDVLAGLRSGADRIGHVIAFGDDRAAATVTANRAQEMLKVHAD